MTAFKLTEAPALEPVSLDEMKTHARLDGTEEDALLSGLITAARQWAERYTNRGFIGQTWQLWLDAPMREGQRAIRLPRAPLLSVLKVQSFSQDGTPTICDSWNYYVDTIHEPGRLIPESSGVWPLPGRVANGLMIEYRVGYGETSEAVPQPIRLAIRQLALHWYEHRGEELMPGTASDETSSRYGAINVPLLIQALLNPYRVA